MHKVCKFIPLVLVICLIFTIYAALLLSLLPNANKFSTNSIITYIIVIVILTILLFGSIYAVYIKYMSCIRSPIYKEIHVNERFLSSDSYAGEYAPA